MSSFPTSKGLTQLDPGGVLRNAHEIQAEALRTIDIDNLVGSYFTRADVTYNGQQSATAATFYYDKNNHIEIVTCTGDVASNLNNTYFLLDGPRGTNLYYVWYNVDGLGTDPTIVGRQEIEVPISANDSAQIVALATRLACNLNSVLASEFTIQSIDFKVKFTGKIKGNADFDLASSNFTSEVISEGVTELVKTISLPYTNGVRYVYNEYEKTFEIFPSIAVAIDGNTSPTISNFTMTLANTEYSVAFPATTKKYKIMARGNVKLQMAFVNGTTATAFTTIFPGNSYIEEGLELNSILNLYFQSNKPNEVLEVLYWE